MSYNTGVISLVAVEHYSCHLHGDWKRNNILLLLAQTQQTLQCGQYLHRFAAMTLSANIYIISCPKNVVFP